MEFVIENFEKKGSIYDKKNQFWSDLGYIINERNENHAKSKYTNEFGQKILSALIANGSGLAQVFRRFLLCEYSTIVFFRQKKIRLIQKKNLLSFVYRSMMILEFE